MRLLLLAIGFIIGFSIGYCEFQADAAEPEQKQQPAPKPKPHKTKTRLA